MWTCQQCQQYYIGLKKGKAFDFTGKEEENAISCKHVPYYNKTSPPKKCPVEHRLHKNVLNSNQFCFGQTLARGTEDEIHVASKVLKKIIHIVMLIEASRRTWLQICKKKNNNNPLTDGWFASVKCTATLAYLLRAPCLMNHACHLSAHWRMSWLNDVYKGWFVFLKSCLMW